MQARFCKLLRTEMCQIAFSAQPQEATASIGVNVFYSFILATECHEQTGKQVSSYPLVGV